MAWIDLFDDLVYRGFFGDDALTKHVEILNGLNDGIRQDAKNQAFKKIIRNYVRLLRQNSQSLVEYIDNLFEHHARLLVLRIDFGYGMKERWAATESELLTEYEQAKEDYKHFVNNQRGNYLFKHRVGQIWKLEYGLSKGFHYHLILFFDGSRVQQDITLAKLVGEYWKNNITQGRGLYWNCNANKNSYKALGIGMINHYDKELIDNLKKATEYLTKADYFARIVSQGIGRTFGRGKIKAKTNNRGRRRKYSSLLSNERIQA